MAEGYAQGHGGAGSVVAAASQAPRKEAGPAAALRPSPRFADWSPHFRPPSSGCRFDLRPGLPDPALFPAGRIRLRRAIADWVARSRSVTAAPDTVVITCGAQHAIDLVARVLLEPGDCVAVEDPGYVPTCCRTQRASSTSPPRISIRSA